VEKRFLAFFVVLFSLVSLQKSQDFNELLTKLCDKIVLGLDFSSPKTVCVFEFENMSSRSPSFLQNIYQLFLATLEKKLTENIKIDDEVIGFDENVGYFNLSEEKIYDYLFSLTYYERNGKTSLSIKVFDGREPEKLIAFFYSSSPLNLNEIELIEKPLSRQFSFISPLYEPIYLPFTPLDLRFFDENKLIFLTEKKLLFYEIEGDRLKFSEELNLNWEKPIFPSQDLTGRIYFDLIDDLPVIFADSSLSSSVLLLTNKENQWTLLKSLNYIPLEKITIGNRLYFLCGKIREGMNSFKDKVALFQPQAFISDNSNPQREINLIPFYEILPVNDEKGRFFGIYILDKTGRLRFFNRNFKELKIPDFKAGDRLISIGNYILSSKFGRNENDSLLVISGKERSILQEVQLNGNIVSMAYNGSDKIAVICRDINGNSYLHLWRKK